MKIFLGISILILLVIIYFAFLKNQNLSTGGVKKYDIQMLFSAMMWNTFWFGLLYYIIGPDKMQEFWFVLIFMVILSLFQYIWKWDYAWALYLGCFFFLIIYLKRHDIINFVFKDEKLESVRFEIFNKETGQIYKGWTPAKKLRINYEYSIQPEIGSSIQVEIIGKDFYHVDTLNGGDNWDVNFPRHPKNARFFITAVQ